MDDRRLSKLLSLVLRHQPDRFGITLDGAGWADVEQLLRALHEHGAAVDRDDLDRVVAGNDKQRFAYDATGARLRASQGHSVPVDLGLAPRRPPDRLWHGTPERQLASILAEGLRPGSRHAVHLSSDVATARRVGSRRGRAVVLAVDAGRLHRDGHVFTRSDNGVWLVAAVPAPYLRVVEGPTAQPRRVGAVLAGAPVPVAEVVRNDFVEGRHHGSVVAVDPDGSVAWSRGAVDVPMLPRSCAKPLQAVAMVRAGLPLRGELLALTAASHSGEPFHLEGVRRVLAGAGLTEAALQTPPDLPLDDAAREQVLAAGGTRTSLAMNCSGKHAAMLATCVVNGWETGSYLDPDHPLQRAITATVEELTGVPVEVTAVDGCGAPLLSTTLTGLARAFSRLAASDEPALAAVADAVRAHPEWVSGTRRDEAALLRAIPGAVAKAGAEACYAVALADGRAVALKVEDGGARARPVVMAAALRRLGVLDEPGVDAAAVEATGRHVVLGGGRPVGSVRPVL